MAGRVSALVDMASRQDELHAAARLLQSRGRTTLKQRAQRWMVMQGHRFSLAAMPQTLRSHWRTAQGWRSRALALPQVVATPEISAISLRHSALTTGLSPPSTVRCFRFSSRIAGLETTREGLEIINDTAQAELLRETGVDLDEEAANLIRLQQAFEANSRVIQVATELFDTILGLG